jgi:hypothetical protein
MSATSEFGRRSIRSLIIVIALFAVVGTVGSAIVLGAGQGDLAKVRAATSAFHEISAAEKAGYGPFYVCTDENSGLGAMGQHYVNGALVGDPEVNALTPEAVIYEPMPGGGSRLVGVEYVTFKEARDAIHSSPPALFGRNFKLIPAGNRYDLPDFYELHVWLWQPNPSGIFNDWNPSVTCRGQGDPA